MGDLTWSDAAPSLLSIGALLCLSGFFSGTEVAMFSLRRTDREQMARSGRGVDSILLGVLAQPRRLIATLLIGNEIVNITISAIMAGLGEQVLIGYGQVTIALLTTVATLPLLVVVGEIPPKTVAFKAPVRWARLAARPVYLFGLIITPVRVVVRFVADQIARPFGGGSSDPHERALGEAEFRALVDAGSAEGQVEAHERRLIHRVFEFGDTRVGQVMVPAQDVFALSYDLPMSRIVKEVAERGFSRVPIYHKSRDNIRGVLYAKDLVLHGVGLTAPQRLGDLLHDPLFVPRTIPVERLFRIFKQRRTHIALVVNEYGKLLGLVTMEDALAVLFGEIRDEKESQARRRRVYTPAPLPVVRPDAAAAPAGAATSAAGEAAAVIDPAVPEPVQEPADVIGESRIRGDLTPLPPPDGSGSEGGTA